MSDNLHDRRRLLASESSDLSDFSTASTFLATPSPSSPARQRPGYTRLESIPGEEDQSKNAHHQQQNQEDIADTFDVSSASRGLGIATGVAPAGTRRVSVQSIPRVPVRAKDPDLKASGSADPFTSPLLSFSPSNDTGYKGAQGASDIQDSGRSHRTQRSFSSLNSAFQEPYLANPSTDNLNKKRATASIRSAYQGFSPQVACPTHKHFYQGRTYWLSIVILVLSIYSTVFSGIYLVLALHEPRYGRTIRTNGRLTASTASLLTALFAKTIELSFVTVFVAFLAQVLSRRAFMKEAGRGITLAEMSMRAWVFQPGTMITHWESVRYAAMSLLGVISLMAAIVAMLYTTASDALVQPALKFGPWENIMMQGLVKSSFANTNYVSRLCQTPIRDQDDEKTRGTTCLQIEHAAQGYHNYQRYLSNWDNLADNGNGTTDLATRPQGFGLLHENTSITASWIDVVDVGEASEKHGRIVNNVTLAMPHAGVFQAARDGINGIIQPEELDGLGVYSLRASAPSPIVNVLCVNMNQDELAPIVYETWPDAVTPVNTSTWPSQAPYAMNKTVVDDVFGWRNDTMHPPPTFPKYPIKYNTIQNFSASWGPSSIYILGAGVIPNEYFLCSLKAGLTPNCSTRYNASSSGGTLEAICEDPNDDLAYIRSMTNASSGAATDSSDWKDIGEEWGKSLSLNSGIVEGNASNARLLTQLMLQSPEGVKPVLNAALPSPAEALAVMAGCTLLMSSQDTPFVEFWNFSSPILENGQYQYFNASLRAQQYASGGTTPYQRFFLIVLVLVFATNCLCLLYFIFHKGLVTDFSEPPNLFSLAVNSPPSDVMAGSCGGGPEGRQYNASWFVNTEGEHLFMESKEQGFTTGRAGSVREEELEMGGSPIAKMYNKLSKRTSRL